MFVIKKAKGTYFPSVPKKSSSVEREEYVESKWHIGQLSSASMGCP